MSDFLHAYINQKGFAPSYAEIQKHFGFASINAVTKHLKALQAKGVVDMRRCGRRSLSVPKGTLPAGGVDNCEGHIQLPIIGEVSAGLPIATFSCATMLTLPQSMVPNPESTYVLKVNGQNLQDEMIIDGDFIVVEARQQAAAGDTVVALINKHETVISQYHPMGELIQLIDRNRNHHPMVLRSEDVEIQGVVVLLLRTYT